MKVPARPGPHRRCAGLTAAGATVALLVTGCGAIADLKADRTSAATSTTTVSSGVVSTAPVTSTLVAAPGDYSALLMDATELPSVGEPFVMDAPVLNPNDVKGVVAAYRTESGSATIGDTIALLDDPTQVAGAATKIVDSFLQTEVKGEPAASPIGTGGTVIAGTSPDGTRAATALIFTEQNAVVTLMFDNRPGDLTPIPPDFVESAGRLQLDALRAALPAVTAASPSAGAAKVTVGGVAQPATGPVVCSTTEGKFSITVGEPGAGVVIGLEGDGSAVHHIEFGTVDGVDLRFTEGVPDNTAGAVKDGKHYDITGSATGTDPAGAPVTKPFEIDVTCP
ncbi:MAG: lipoprotein LpqH [Mycobacterium sp.]|nr:lipoprotein LpqH [Mycobacterium sp.]